VAPPKPLKAIYLLTDFGFEGQHYVAQLRGVIRNLVPKDCLIEDITHAVEPFSVIQAEFFLMTTFSYLLHPCIVLAVVDPGVGTSRDIVAILDKDDNVLIGPNNGLFGRFPPQSRIVEVRKVENPKIIAKLGSMTFQGRDIMAPAAAWLVKKLPFSEIGSLAGDLLINDIQSPEIDQNVATGGIYSIDSFGNVITNLPANFVRDSSLEQGTIIHVEVGGIEEDFQFGTTFADVQVAERVAYVGSSMFLELAVNQGSAVALLDCNVGNRIRLEWD
jgi:hypothetical protein